jgi:hypothetical protein
MTAKFKLLRRILKIWVKNRSNLNKLIANSNLIVAFFDRLEELRSLTDPKSRFRFIIKSHLQKLLIVQREYWKQRYTQHFVQFGDENSKFFHAMATERYRKNVSVRNVVPTLTSDERQGLSLNGRC